MDMEYEYIGFASAAAAYAYRNKQGCGGWVFAAESGAAILFRRQLTATQVMLHAATRGQSGTLG